MNNHSTVDHPDAFRADVELESTQPSPPKKMTVVCLNVCLVGFVFRDFFDSLKACFFVLFSDMLRFCAALLQFRLNYHISVILVSFKLTYNFVLAKENKIQLKVLFYCSP